MNESVNNIFLRLRPYLAFVVCSLLLISVETASSQNEGIESIPAPPPLKLLEKSERDQLDRASGVRTRTQLSLKLMDSRLQNAESFTSRQMFDEAFVELGAFHAIMDDALDSLGANKSMTHRVLTNFKRFEIGVRRFNPRLELIRREFPGSHEYYVRSLIGHLRDARTRATEPLFGDTVLPDN